MDLAKAASRRSDWLLLVLAFVLLCVANGRWIVAPAAWLAPLFLLIFIDSRPPRSGLAWACLALLLAFFVNWRGLIPVPGAWYYLVAGIYAVVYFLPFLVHRLVAPRPASFRSTLVFPACSVVIELILQKLVTPYGSWASPAYTQTGFLPLIQLASITGLAGIHFVMMWSVSVLSWVWGRRGAPFARVRGGVAVCASVMLVLFVWGQWRVRSVPEDAPRLRVATLTPSAKLTRELQRELSAQAGRLSSEASSLEVLSGIAWRINEDLLERTERAVASEADVVVWSENAARVTRRTEPRLIERAQILARSAGVHLILGVGLWDPSARPSFENKVLMIDPRGRSRGTYHKARPIVGQESGLIGEGDSTIATLDTARGRFGIAICHDLDFPGLLREAGRRGVVVLFGPSSDWDAITPFHAHMSIPRAVENGCSLVRPSAKGLSLVVDPFGRILSSRIDRGEEGNLLLSDVPLFRLRTPYRILGDAFAYACAVLLVLLLADRLRLTVFSRGKSEGGSW